MTYQRYMVLDLGASDDLVRVVDRALVAAGNASGHTFEYNASAPSDTGIVLHSWSAAGESMARVTVADDHSMPARYLLLEADDQAAYRAIDEALADNLLIVSFEELKRRATRPGAPPASLTQMGLGAGPVPDPEAIRIIVRGLESNERDVVDAAVMAASLTRWGAFVPVLRRVQAVTSDEGIARMAAQALIDCGGLP